MIAAFVFAGLALLAAFWALAPGGGRPGRLRRAAIGRSARPFTDASSPPGASTWVPGGIALAAGMLLLPPSSWLLAGTGAVLVTTATWVVRRGAAGRARLRHRAEVVRACGVIAGQLEIGEIPAKALQTGAQDCPLVAPAAAALAIGGDATVALRSTGRLPGCAGLVDLADGWRLCERTGMPLAQAVRRIADAIRAQADDEAAREAELSTARATGRLMVVLPGVGMILGYFVNADPLGFLFGSWIGQLCLLGASVFASAGLVWTQKLSEEPA